MLDPQGDLALARAAARLGVPFTLSTMSTTRLEDVASRAGGRLWMQLYVLKDRAIARDIMQRATAAGYEALVFTTDANVFGSREWDQRSYRAPGKPTIRTALDVLRHPRWAFEVLGRHGMPRFRNLEAFLPPSAASALGGSTVIPPLFDATICWDDITWIRQLWRGKLLIKGVLSVADAERAAALGCDGIVLSNHGGRQLDSGVTPIEVLPQIAHAVGERLPILIDSGFRRGTDIVKALALGAQAIMIGRATLYGLAAGSEPGVDRGAGDSDRRNPPGARSAGLQFHRDLGPQHVRGPSRTRFTALTLRGLKQRLEILLPQHRVGVRAMPCVRSLNGITSARPRGTR